MLSVRCIKLHILLAPKSFLQWVSQQKYDYFLIHHRKILSAMMYSYHLWRIIVECRTNYVCDIKSNNIVIVNVFWLPRSHRQKAHQDDVLFLLYARKKQTVLWHRHAEQRNEKGLPRGKPFCSLELRGKLFLPFGFFGSHVVVLIVVFGCTFKGVIGFQ